MFIQWLKTVTDKSINLYTLALISFLESFLPLPIMTDPFLVAGVAAKRKQVFILTLVCTMASVIGGLLAYLSALFFWSLLSAYLPTSYLAQFNELIAGNDMNTFILTTTGALTPLPYTFSAWAVALIQGNVVVFLLTSLFARGLRYVVVGYLTYKLGPLVVANFNNYKLWLAGSGILLVLILVFIKFYLP